MIRCDDWRHFPSSAIEPLLQHERDAWLRELHWDVRSAWQGVEPARRAGTLPGFVARSADGTPLGWTSFLLHRDTVQVLAFVAADAPTADALVDAILDSAERATVGAVLFCVRTASDALPHALAARGFRVEPYRYLSADLTPRVPAFGGLRPWAGDGDRLGRLLAGAYERETTTRAFAPGGTAPEWTEYVAALLTTTGCGRFAPGLSFVAPSSQTGAIAGAVIVTELSSRTSHIAQIAVAPGDRGRGLGGQLVFAAMAAAASAGHARMTLLVAASNRSAIGLYERAGFTDRSSFTVAMAGPDALSAPPALATVTSAVAL